MVLSFKNVLQIQKPKIKKKEHMFVSDENIHQPKNIMYVFLVFKQSFVFILGMRLQFKRK